MNSLVSSLEPPLPQRSMPHPSGPLTRRLIPPSGFAAESRGDLRDVARARARVRDVVSGDDDRLLVVVGPCSIDDPNSALLYAERLLEAQHATEDALVICMRTYFEKPRTTVGWKGWFSDPHVDDSHDVEYGLRSGLELLARLSSMQLPCAVELLDPLFVPYVADWVSWAAVGARTTESQVHRQLVSGLPLPVGFKNSTDGSVDVAVDAMLAARESHHFPTICVDGRLQLVTSQGNAATHVVLRGGAQGPNSDADSVRKAHEALVARGAQQRSVMIDCSHANSRKDYRNQPRVAQDVAAQVAEGGPILGVMLESYLIEGKQAAVPLSQRVRGQSLTDGCIDVGTTLDVLQQLATAVRSRRRR